MLHRRSHSAFSQMLTLQDSTRRIGQVQLRTTFKAGKPITNKVDRAGRNDPCPCGSGKKFKKCCHAK